MVLGLHIVIATASLLFSIYTFLLPSGLKVRISQGLIILTITSGTYLVLTMHVNLLKVCTMGLIYTAIVSYATVAAGRELAAEQAPERQP